MIKIGNITFEGNRIGPFSMSQGRDEKTKFLIDGREFEGNSIFVGRDGRVIVDGVLQEGALMGVVEIRVVEGVLQNLHCEMDVHAGTVHGNVTAGMSVTCGDVGGNVNASMSVNCGDIHGDVEAGMGVSYKGRRRS